MKNTSTFSSEEMDTLIDRLETLMVQLKKQSTADREEIQASFPTLSRSRVDAMISKAPSTPVELIPEIKRMVQYLIGKKY